MHHLPGNVHAERYLLRLITEPDAPGEQTGVKNNRCKRKDTDVRRQDDEYFVQSEQNGNTQGCENLKSPDRKDPDEDSEPDGDRFYTVRFVRVE